MSSAETCVMKAGADEVLDVDIASWYLVGMDFRSGCQMPPR